MLERDVEHVALVEEESFDGDAGSTSLSEHDLRTELARPWARLWVFDRNVPLGFMLAWHVADELHVHNVAVHPQHRRQGIARALMDEVMRYMTEFGVSRSWLEVRKSNEPARRLYEGFGYEVVGERAAYYADGEDALEMAWLRPLPD
jgi:ribosomal-protein-alanine N-acetyltransferase